MIRVDIAAGRLRPAERFGLDVLLDLSRILVAEQAECDVVRLTVVDRPYSEAPATDLAPSHAIERAEGEVRVSTAALFAVAEVAGGATEQRSGAVDRHGRFPAEENPLVVAGRSREPLVSALGVELRRAVVAVAGRRPLRFLAPWPNGYRWAALVTHDVEGLEWWGLSPLLRMAEFSRRGAWRETAQVARAAWRSIGGDPVSRGVHAVLQLEAHYGVSATWFVICSEPVMGSAVRGHSIGRANEPIASRIMSAVIRAGHEIGFHGSLDDPEQLASQRHWLSRMTQRPIRGARQASLRMRPGPTQRAMVKAGFDYDATWGFADRNGFRLGVADVVPAWDAARESLMPLDLVPLAWIDRARNAYSGVEEAQRWIDDGLELARLARSVEGAWVGLWHPNLTEALGFPGAEPAFVHLLQNLANNRPYFASASKVVEWRRFRRSVRAQRVSADGRVFLTAMSGRPTVTIEDEAGDSTQAEVRLERSSGAA